MHLILSQCKTDVSRVNACWSATDAWNLSWVLPDSKKVMQSLVHTWVAKNIDCVIREIVTCELNWENDEADQGQQRKMKKEIRWHHYPFREHIL